MPSREVLAVDQDDNITTFDGPFRNPWVYETTGTLLINPKEGEFAYEKAYEKSGFTKARVDRLIDEFLMSPKSLEWITPYPGAVDAIARLSEHYEIHIVTARSAIHREMTEKLLMMHFDGYIEELHMPNSGDDHVSTDKATVCKTIGAVALIDDADHNINQVMDIGIQGILTKHEGHRHNGHNVHSDAIIVPDLMTIVRLDEFRQEEGRWPTQTEVKSILASRSDSQG